MLDSLEIRNLGLISHAQLKLEPGLVVVTGETGAGKSLLFDAVRALAGAKPKLFNEAGDALVSGELRVSNAELDQNLQNVDAIVEDGYVQIYRNFPIEGRSKTTLGGRSIPAAVLVELADHWLVVHGQHDSQRLLVASTHRIILDRFGGMDLWRKLDEHATNYRTYKTAVSELRAAQKKAQELAERAEAMRADLAISQSLNVVVGEETEIANRIERLSRVDEIKNSVERTLQALGAEEIHSSLHSARKALEQGLATDSAAVELASRLGNLQLELQDITASVAAISEGIENDPAEIDALMLRSRQLKSLLLRHGPDTKALLEWTEAAARELRLLDPDSQILSGLEQAVQAALAKAEKSALELHDLRLNAARSLEANVSSELKALALPHAIFEVAIEKSELSESGADRVEFKFSANPGLATSPIATAASGGELSRLMLALEVVLVEGSTEYGPSVMLFDEVDAGVAGEAAISVAERLAKLAQTRQVLVVTHLPQLAAFADQHIVVNKDSNGLVTESFVQTIDNQSRPAELARMLAGVANSDAAVIHATELIEMAQNWKERNSRV